MADPFEAIRAHLEKHTGKERATFSIAGVKALLDAIDAARSAPEAGKAVDVRQIIFEALDLSEELRVECTADVVNALDAAGISLARPHPVAPTEIRNEEFGFVEFINQDVPYIAREIDGRAAVLLDMETRAVIGYRVYDPAAKEDWKPTHQHLKRRSLYRFVGNATLQASMPLRDMDAMVVYQAEDGSLWVRPQAEFFDGRFLTLAGGETP